MALDVLYKVTRNGFPNDPVLLLLIVLNLRTEKVLKEAISLMVETPSLPHLSIKHWFAFLTGDNGSGHFGFCFYNVKFSTLKNH